MGDIARARAVAIDPAEPTIRAAITSNRHDDAFALIRTAYGAAIARVARRMVRDRAAAEDVEQDALLRIHQGLSTIREGTALRAWVMTIVHHRALDELRRTGRQRRRFVDGVDAADAVDGRATAARALEALEQRRAVVACVERLPPRIRMSLVLYFGQELTFEEVGAMQGEHGGTVRIRIVRALERLRSQMARRGHGPGAEAAPLTRRAG